MILALAIHKDGSWNELMPFFPLAWCVRHQRHGQQNEGWQRELERDVPQGLQAIDAWPGHVTTATRS
jgi:hypothetical protein